MNGREKRVDRWGMALALALGLGLPVSDCRRAEANGDAGSARAGADGVRPLMPPPSCAGTVPRLELLPPGYGWHCYEDADEPRFSFCMRAAEDCEVTRRNTISTLAGRGETHRIGSCAPQPGAYCHTFVDLAQSQPLYFCFPNRDGCAASTRVLGAQPETYGEVSCCEAIVTL
ncbi:MAG: hypothetical protein JXB32_01245 [Deltaproteobacteria bacterium]|nr:hypothetical protein [Deltaproteobacteria bacterium]